MNPAPAPALTDAQVFRTYFFVPGYERDPARLHAFDLEQLLTGAAREMKKDAPPVNLKVVYPPGSVQLTETRFQPRGDAEMRIEVRTLHDSYMLTTTIQRRGPIPPGPDPPLAPHVPRIFGDLSLDKYLGKVTIFAAEVPAGAGHTEIVGAARAYAARHAFPPDAALATTDAAAVLIDPALPAPGEKDAIEPRCVVVYPAGTDVKRFLRVALPELFLYHVKVRVLYQDVRGHRLSVLREEDEKIRELHAETRDPAGFTADALLAANDRLTTLLTELVTAVAETENAVHTSEIARKNFTRAATECRFNPDELPNLTRVLMDDWVATLGDLATAALGYRRRTHDVARVHFESLQATVEVHQARETRSLAVVMALLTCAQVGAVVLTVVGDSTWEKWLGEGTAPGWGVVLRLILTLVCTVGLFWVSWAVWLRRPGTTRKPKYRKPPTK